MYNNICIFLDRFLPPAHTIHMSLSHDPFLRNLLSGKQEAIDFLLDSLPKKISGLLDFTGLELIRESFIGENQEESRTDLLFKIPLKEGSSSVTIYLLFEHKSYLDRKIYVQLLDYLSKIYRRQMENDKRLTVVLPFVFYHGEKRWDLGAEFLDTFDKASIPNALLRFIPNFSIHLEILSAKGSAFQTKNLALRLSLRVLQTIRNNPEEFVENLKEVFLSLLEEKEEAKRIEILKKLFQYILKARTEDGEILTKNAMINEIEGDYMNMLERISYEGELKGKLEKAIETARKMWEEDDSLEKIIRITGLTEIQLKENGIPPVG
jgi:predicted transposase/invertase (TIGR01784 family)